MVCDGWPVQLYARLCELQVARVTGCHLTTELMRLAPYPISQRLLFVADSVAMEQAVFAWAERHAVLCDVTIPPFGFERDPGYYQRLASTIRGFSSTILIMAVGSPRSEVFVNSYRTLLPPCWAFCVGQAVKAELGLVQRASSKWRSLGKEWLWRTLQEPSRLTKRYITATVGFGIAVVEDQLRNRRLSRS